MPDLILRSQGTDTIDISNVRDAAQNVIAPVSGYTVTTDSPDAPTTFALH